MAKENLDDAIARGIYYLLGNRTPEGMWNNFLSRTNGESTSWVTSYVGFSLIKSGVSPSELFRTAKSLLSRQGKDGGFGYNEKIFPDADSTAFAILFLSQFNYHTSVQDAKEFLLTHQKEDGGIGTYLEKNIRQYSRNPPELSVAGWCQSTVDVTSSVLQAMPGNRRVKEYLAREMVDGNHWHSYWWTDDIYATARAIISLADQEPQLKLDDAVRWLAERHHPFPFYDGLAVQALLSCPNKKSGEIESRIKKLLITQRVDGSWPNGPILKFPHPSNMAPWENSQMWRESSADQHSLFTTATCVKALSDYKRSLS